jgi:hypothetical protein
VTSHIAHRATRRPTLLRIIRILRLSDGVFAESRETPARFVKDLASKPFRELRLSIDVSV